MQFDNPLQQAFLVRRYKRFLADVYHPDWPEHSTPEQPLTVHCPNTGAMTGCAEADMKVWLSASENPKRKYRYTWELAQTQAGNRICINTHRANTVVGEALLTGKLAALSDLSALQPEQRYGYDNRRIDWLATDSCGRKVFIEVKSVTLAEGSQGYFPDTVSKRASEHLKSLMTMANEGHRAVVVYCVFHSAVEQVSAADHCDPEYARTAVQARQQGVEFYAVQCAISAEGITVVGELPVQTRNK
ncbi:DNA/RNA nuclease SfsA [Pseudidiomarina insulisalsae]|uniref:Sugar fermentation stimulation protein homolog n=1 Tax=Pseudidiomarina insulisalsae TaxID=575789 RepID=A0A432YA07_9GAMM|nr:DNA/RNA nuclease SfsA [Pseudidiomarina insulisalsae]RUO57810.1 DNA/RNA nuclease SfsA [Pseudidiomarina insulisalsae]